MNESRLEYKTFPARELRVAGVEEDPSTWRLMGWGSVFFSVDASWTADVMAPGCFAEELPLFLERGFVGGRGHDWDNPIGRPLVAEERDHGLWVEGTISNTQHGRETRTLVRDGVIRFFSIGFRTLAKTYLEDFEQVAAWWESQGYRPTAADVSRAQFGCRRLDRVRLYEFSPVSLPCCDGAAIVGAKQVFSFEGEPLAGSPLSDHSEKVLAAVEEWVERMGALKELRAQEGRAMSPDHLAGLKRVRDRLEMVLARASRSDGRDAVVEAARLAAEFEAFEARIRGDN
jgi:HK97 family phage prohead protease